MKVKKMFLAIVVVSMVIVFAMNVYAGWYICKVNMAGPGWGNRCFIKLSDTAASPAFKKTWFVALDSQKKEMLATALTAMDNNCNVVVYIGSTSEYSIIYAMYLISP